MAHEESISQFAHAEEISVAEPGARFAPRVGPLAPELVDGAASVEAEAAVAVIGWKRMKHRLTLFSDAVYAIIITLMVLDLRTPETPGWHGWWHLLPAIGGYSATFALLLVIWLHHHHIFGRVREINWAMFWFNGAALFFASLLPLTLRSVIEHPRDPAAYIVYQVVAWNAMISMAWFRWAASKMHGSDPGWKEWTRKRNRVAGIGTLQAAAFCALTFVYLPAAIAIYLAMLIFMIVSIKGTMDTEEA